MNVQNTGVNLTTGLYELNKSGNDYSGSGNHAALYDPSWTINRQSRPNSAFRINKEDTDTYFTVPAAGTQRSGGFYRRFLGAYTFTPQNWAGLQTVTVTGLDDSLVDGITEYFVRFALSSSDSVFDGITVDSVKAFTIDNDRPDLIISTPDAVHEYGTVSEISVRLASPPSGTVEIAAASSNTGKGT
ncbi:hypothetical protein CHS0354_001949 [Potamilus streckersoni]|uniref:Uncharacterized protein n=1 Tax=Potamilus streckersoni TaxID=2493646 RepID=A0AAE0W8B7_9BIVA|nr:hypothetical protein CHS0354_001949 [Potamilus streckersoni]